MVLLLTKHPLCSSVIAAETGEKPAIRVMKTTVKNVRVFGVEDSVRYRVEFADTFKGIRKIDGEYQEVDVNHVDFVPRHLIAICIDKIEGLDLLYTQRKEKGLRNSNAAGFGAADLAVVLRGATFDMERVAFAAGEEYTTNDGNTAVHEYDGYNTVVNDISVSERVQAKLDNIIDKFFEI